MDSVPRDRPSLRDPMATASSGGEAAASSLGHVPEGAVGDVEDGLAILDVQDGVPDGDRRSAQLEQPALGASEPIDGGGSLLEVTGQGRREKWEWRSVADTLGRLLFRAAELEAFLRRGGLELLSLSASNALSTGVELPASSDPSTGSALLEYERAACVERGYLDSGSHLLAVARR